MTRNKREAGRKRLLQLKIDIKNKLNIHTELDISFEIIYNGKVDLCKSIEMRPDNIIIDLGS